MVTWWKPLCAIGHFNRFNRFKNALRMKSTKPGEGGRKKGAPTEQPEPVVALRSCGWKIYPLKLERTWRAGFLAGYRVRRAVCWASSRETR